MTLYRQDRLSSIFLLNITIPALICLLVQGELYTSVDELSKLSQNKHEIVGIIDEQIGLQEARLAKLYNLQSAVIKILELNNEQQDKHYSTTKSYHQDESHAKSANYDDKRMAHPVGAFVTLHRLVKAIDEIHMFLGEQEEEEADSSKHRMRSSFDELTGRLNLPTEDDLYGCGEALVRLQIFYDLDIDHLVQGRIHSNSKIISEYSESTLEGRDEINAPPMNHDDCFEIGKISYESEFYLIAIEWFQKTLELIENEENKIALEGSHNVDTSSLNARIGNILEYMAFAAYKSGQITYAARLTNLWLERDPNNEKARDNLEYYEEELTDRSQNSDHQEFNSTVLEQLETNEQVRQYSPSLSNTYQPGTEFNNTNYVVTDDKIVRDLCRGSTLNTILSQDKKCTKLIKFTNYPYLPEIRIETLNSNPNILRIHDIITETEASYLRQTALPKLERSTVQTTRGLVTSNFRIAKTAWLSKRTNFIVDQLEHRISAILNLDLNGSEDLQVVNYGIGGFYGPHLDSARETSSERNNHSSNSSPLISSLKPNDRMATVLIYLNQVEAGGSTVFPRLGLNVEPIERSAVVWFNILKNGLSDEKTLHTGCPVLLGSKWIATKWLREEANSFLRPCGLKSNE